MAWWRCERCGYRYVSHPKKCEQCDATAFDLYDPSPQERLLRPTVVVTAVGLVFLLGVVGLNYV